METLTEYDRFYWHEHADSMWKRVHKARMNELKKVCPYCSRKNIEVIKKEEQPTESTNIKLEPTE